MDSVPQDASSQDDAAQNSKNSDAVSERDEFTQQVVPAEQVEPGYFVEPAVYVEQPMYVEPAMYVEHAMYVEAAAPVESAKSAEVPVAEVPVAEVPVAEVPVAEVPVAEVPVAEVPVAEVPVAEVPVAEVPVAEVPVAEVPVAEVPVAEVPVAEVPVAEVPVAEVPVAEVPVAEVPVAEVPVAEVPVAEVPVAEVPVAEVPVAEVPVAEVPVADTPAPVEPTALVVEVEPAQLPSQEEDVAQTSRAERKSEEASQADVESVAKDKSGKSSEANGFAALSLPPVLQQTIESLGYAQPTEVQAAIIPHMLSGRDVLAQSQTGTGKTAAFALPILSRVDTRARHAQTLILVPTRELAIQVARSFSNYGKNIDDFSVAAIYGGQDYEPQLRQLRRGAQVVVGTPGRVIDHIRRGSLNIGKIDCLVLDEADEMLNMGFLEDVQFVLQQASDERQIALFSATLPGPIQDIAQQYLTDPATIKIRTKTMTADSIRQRALFVPPREKVDALCRILEAEETDGVIVFTKTKVATMSVAESLSRQGLNAIALNGDMPQTVRERTISQFKAARIDVLVATDVAARGLDVKRVSHVINFDLPHDVESYIHRIGRTGRAGRKGEAIIFLTNAQRRKLRMIEKATKQPIEVMSLPTAEDINRHRVRKFRDQITDVATTQDLGMFQKLIVEYSEESGLPMETVAAALAHLGQQGRPFLAVDRPRRPARDRDERGGNERRGRRDQGSFDSDRGFEANRKPRRVGPPQAGMERYRIEVGRKDGVKPGNIVGAVANEAGIEGEFIGPIAIHDTHSTVDLPEGMPRDIYQTLRKTWVSGKPMRLSLAKDGGDDSGGFERDSRSNGKPRHHGGKKRFTPGKGKPHNGGKKKGKKKGTPISS